MEHPPDSSPFDEPDFVRERYERRAKLTIDYTLLNRAMLLIAQERQRALTDLFRRLAWSDLAEIRLIEVGCGWGGNLLELLQFGFKPEHLQGIELLSVRGEEARLVLPKALRIRIGDAVTMEPLIPVDSQDVVYQSTVFSSLLNDAFQKRLADVMWKWVRPGGGVLSYDFTVNNPRNRDVRGIPVTRIRELFPSGRLHVRRLTLAPPIARAVTRVYPALYGVFNACPLLRTHVLAWIEKPR